MMHPKQPMTPTEALANIAYCLLSVRGQSDKPTTNEIMLAVVQASPVLDITMDANAATIQLEAADKLIRRHKWDVGKVVLLKSGFAANNLEHKSRRKNDNGSPRGVSR